MAAGIARLLPPPKFIHQLENPLADFKQFLPRLRDHFFRQQIPARHTFQPGLGLVQMIQCALEIRHGEGGIARITALRQPLQGAGELHTGGLKFEDELVQLVVARIA